MAEELQYTVKFRTTAEGNGAKQTADGIDGVTEAQKRHNKTQAEGKPGRDALLRSMTDTADKARVAEFAFYDLDAAQTRTANTSEQVGRKTDEAGKKSAQFGQNMLQAAYAADDLQYGLRGIVNNVPMLAQAFGLAPAMAGGIAIAAVALNQVLPLIQQGLSGTMELGETAQDVLSNAANFALSQLEKQQGALEDQAKKAKLAMSPDAAGDEAVLKAAKAREEQLKTIALVSEQLNQILGRQATALETIAETERASAAARKIAADEAIAAENKKVEAAENALRNAQIDRDTKVQSLALAQLNAQALESEVEKLRVKRDLLEQTSKQRVGLGEALAMGGVLPGQRTAAAEAAASQLQNVENDLNAAAVKANNFRSAADKMITTLSRYDEVISGAAQAFERQKAASEQNVETILQQQGVQAAADKASGIQTATSAIAGQLTSAVDLAKEQVGVLDGAAKEIQTLLVDGLSPEELRKVPGLVQQLIGTYKGDVQQLQSILTGVIEAANITSATTAQLVRDVNDLKRQAANATRGAGSP